MAKKTAKPKTDTADEQMRERILSLCHTDQWAFPTILKRAQAYYDWLKTGSLG